MDFQKHLENMFTMAKDEFFVFVIGGVVIQLLVALSFGLLAGPLIGGYILVMVHWFRTGDRPRFNDIFSGMKRFGEFFPFFFLILLILLGYLLFLIPGLVMTVWWLYALLLVGDKKISLADAMAESKAKVTEKGFFMHFAFILAIAVIPSILIDGIAAIIPPLGILHLFLFPLQCGCQASLYLEQFDDEGRRGMLGREKRNAGEKIELPVEPSRGQETSLPDSPPQKPPSQNDQG
jgi:hypothetical protein